MLCLSPTPTSLPKVLFNGSGARDSGGSVGEVVPYNDYGHDEGHHDDIEGNRGIAAVAERVEMAPVGIFHRRWRRGGIERGGGNLLAATGVITLERADEALSV